jgi:hypothetical protein
MTPLAIGRVHGYSLEFLRLSKPNRVILLGNRSGNCAISRDGTTPTANSFYGVILAFLAVSRSLSGLKAVRWSRRYAVATL